ncbi:MAG: hypothetical protein RSI33_04905 [Clostridia bacterium]
MRKLIAMLMALMLCSSIAVSATAQSADVTLDFTTINGGDGIQSLCWVDDTLYMLGNEAIYRWQIGDAEPQIYWQQSGIQNYRYISVAPESDAERTLWNQAISYLLSGEDALYALQPYSGQIFEVTPQGLATVAALPQTFLTYQMDSQSVNRELRMVGMQQNAMYILLGTDDPSEWSKTTLVRFDMDTQESKEYSNQNIQRFVTTQDGQLVIISRTDGDNEYSYEVLDTVSGTTTPFFKNTVDAAASGCSGFWQDQLVNCTSGQIVSYAADGIAQMRAYVPVSAYASNSIACSNGNLCAVSCGSYVFLRDLTQPTTQTVLNIMGDINPSALLQFSVQNPDIAIVTVPQATSDAIQQSVLSAGDNVDLYVVEAPGLYTQLKAKGYLASLNEADLLKKKVNAFYPCIQDALMAADQLMAFPINMSTESWTLNRTLWERFALGEVPKTYAELLDMMRVWLDDYSQDNPDYMLVDLPGDLATCVKLLAKEYILQCGSEYPDFSSPTFRDTMLSLMKHQDVITANGELYGMPLIYTYYQGFGIGYNDDERTEMMLMPSVSVGNAQKLSGTLSLITMSSACTKQEAALRFITYFAENADPVIEYMLTPSLTSPRLQKTL